MKNFDHEIYKAHKDYLELKIPYEKCDGAGLSSQEMLKKLWQRITMRESEEGVKVFDNQFHTML